MRKLGIALFLVLMLALTASACGSADNSAASQASPGASPPVLSSSASQRVPADALPEICDCVLRFDHISIEQGLSQSSVRVIFQDSRGFLWFGTEDGLNRYDGYSFKTFKPDPDALDALSDRAITSIVEDHQGYLWIGTGQGGLNRYDPRTERFTHYRHDYSNPLSIGSDRINVLYLDKKGNLWLGTPDGLDLFNHSRNSFTHFNYEPSRPEGITGKTITAILEDSQGRFWVGTAAAGLNHFDPQTKTFTPYPHDPDAAESISNDHVTSIAEGKNGLLWVGTWEGLNRFSPETGTFERFLHAEKDKNSLPGDMVTDLLVDSTGNLWVGTTNGLSRFDRNEDRFIHYRNDPTFSKSLSNNYILSIHEDRGGVLWFGTYGGGVNKYDRQQDRFAYYRHQPGNPDTISGNFIFSIYADSQGYLWIGTLGDGLNRLNWETGEVKRYLSDPSRQNSLINNEIYSIHEDQDGMIWIATVNGLDRLDPDTNRFRHYQHTVSSPPSLSSNTVYQVYVDRANNVWVGTNSGLDRLDRSTGTFIHYTPQVGDPNSLSGTYVTAIREDSNGYLWVGTTGSGLNRFDPQTGKFTRYQYDPVNKRSISNNTILSVYEDSQGRLWFGTAGGGLNLYHPDTDTFTYYLERDGLPNGVVYGILEDDANNLWLSTNFGISRFNPETKTFRNFDAGDGLQSNEFNSGAYAMGQDGKLYFGGINGLTVFHPSQVDESPYVPQVALTSLTQGDRTLSTGSSVETTQNVTVKYPENSLEFEFAALSYNQPNKNQYAYMLEGFDENWHLIGTKRDGRYTNLPGGNYSLLLKASNSDGVWNDSPVRIQVTVIPPFWQTLWFRLLLGVIGVAAVAGGYRLRTKAVEDRNRQLERLVRERTSALEKRNQEIQALYEADERIFRNVSLNQVFQTLVDVAVDMLNADRSVVFAWDEKRTRIVPRVSHGFSPETLRVMEFKEHEGIVGEVMATGRAAIIRRLDPNDFRPDVRAAILNEGIRSFVHLPIIVDHRVIGVFNVGFTRPNLIGDDTTRLFSALTQRASISIANMELFEQTKDLAVMEERNRLARDLHDSAKQKAFAALAQLGTARGILNGHANSANIHLNEAENLVTDVIQELTFLVQEIYPIALQEKGLVTTLREHIFEWENRSDTTVHLVTRGERRLPLEIEQALYRVTQETLANVARHSRARRVDMSLVYNDDSIQLSVSDDGCGFDVGKTHGMGLRSIRERVSSIRGTVQIQSAPGQGTRILVQAPIKSREGGSNGKQQSS